MKKNLMFFAAAAALATPAMAEDAKDVITFNVGSAQVSVLSEGQGTGKAGILLGATPEQLKKYLPDGTYPNATNAFLLRAEGQPTVLVDAGYGRKLFANLASLGVAPEKIDVILLTHLHGDHIGGLLRNGRAAFPNATLCIAKAEVDYWASKANMEALPADKRGNFKLAQQVLTAYGQRLALFTPSPLADVAGAQPLSAGGRTLGAVKPVAAYGHTPGHTAYLLSFDGAQLLIWGDLAHAMAIQMPCPDVAVTYDVNPAQAIASRKQLLAFLAKTKMRAGGMHVSYPAIGNVSAAEHGGYEFKAICDCEGF